jgi:ABC-type nickel/cobalt efflux system permease component RcnA
VNKSGHINIYCVDNIFKIVNVLFIHTLYLSGNGMNKTAPLMNIIGLALVALVSVVVVVRNVQGGAP